MNQRAGDVARTLREKYERILALQLARVPHEHARREMAEVAARWPGALREAEDRTPEQVRERIALLCVIESAASNASDAPPRLEAWMIAQATFHARLRGALVAKRWLGKRRIVSDETRTAYEVHVHERAAHTPDALASDHGSLLIEARAWTTHLDALANPPRGRITEVVHAVVAAELGVSIDEAKALVFGG